MVNICADADSVELKVPCKAEYVRTVRTLIEEVAKAVPLSPEAIEEVKVAASEAVANIVRHAYGRSGEAAPVVVRCSTGCHTLTLEIIDRGVGFKVPTAAAPDTSGEGGLGIILIRGLMDNVDYWSQPNVGTRVRMTKRGSPNGRIPVSHKSPRTAKH